MVSGNYVKCYKSPGNSGLALLVLLISAVHQLQAVYMSSEKNGRPSEALDEHPIDRYLIFYLAWHVGVTDVAHVRRQIGLK